MDNIYYTYHPVNLPDGHPPVYTVPPVVDTPLDADEHVMPNRDKSQPVEYQIISVMVFN